MSKNLAKFQRAIHVALDAVFQRALEQEREEGPTVFDIRSAKFVIFSDQHKGKRDDADDFLICERAFNAALGYYDRLGYTLILLGDVEELWEEWPESVLKAYQHTLALEQKFHQDGRYLRFWGNHDDAWSHPDLVEQWLIPALGGIPLKVREMLILHIQDGKEELGRILLFHGHQGTFNSERIASVSKFAARYIWRPIQRFFKIRVNTPAEDFELRYAHESAMYAWAEEQNKVVLISGHTHRPVFKSESQEEVVRRCLKEAEDEFRRHPDNAKLQQETAELSAELEWVLAQDRLSPKDVPMLKFKKPSYFNTGCCAFLDGDVTGLEFSQGQIRLVRWPDDEGQPKPRVLATAKLEDVFASC